MARLDLYTHVHKAIRALVSEALAVAVRADFGSEPDVFARLTAGARARIGDAKWSEILAATAAPKSEVA